MVELTLLREVYGEHPAWSSSDAVYGCLLEGGLSEAEAANLKCKRVCALWGEEKLVGKPNIREQKAVYLVFNAKENLAIDST